MKAIFNSLGSNYTFSSALRALSLVFLISDNKDLVKLENSLSQMFKGKAYTFYKGRDAIEFALKALGIGSSKSVLTQAFTCWAVEEGIKRSGAKPIFVDVEDGQLNPSLRTLDLAHEKAESVGALIIQHTFGYPADIEAIRSWCNDKNIYLIEDLAQSLGASDSKGNKLGSFADAVILSFGRDKIIDSISGGACILKHETKDLRHKTQSIDSVPLGIVVKDLVYPLITWVIRNTYQFGLGKLLHYLFSKIRLISSATGSPTKKMAKMPGSHASLALEQLNTLDDQILKRRKISKIYSEKLSKFSPVSKKLVARSANLRFPISVDNPNNLVECLKSEKIFLSDRWYKEAVDCGSLQVKSIYKQGNCQNAEKLSTQIVNLPTHKNVNLKDAERIAEALRKCLNLK